MKYITNSTQPISVSYSSERRLTPLEQEIENHKISLKELLKEIRNQEKQFGPGRPICMQDPGYIPNLMTRYKNNLLVVFAEKTDFLVLDQRQAIHLCESITQLFPLK